jgi:diphthamide biosynthesis protein 7
MFRTELCPDAVEFFPHHSDKLVCATYQLHEDGSKTGALHLLRLCEDGSLTELQRINTAANLDVEWSRGAESILCCAQLGTLQFFAESSFRECARVSLSDPRALALAVDWMDERSVACSASDGTVSCWTLHDERVELQREWRAHELEMWCVAADRHSDNVLYTGADDCTMRAWDLRTQTSNATLRYEMGVTCIHPHPTQQHSVVVGSYDETLRLWDMRATRRAVHTFHNGSSLWRIKWNPRGEDAVAIAGTAGGFKIIALTANGFEEKAHHTQPHSSLAYGVSWRADSSCIACCSFYDKCVSIFQVQ